jgi:hypothetical protein
VREERGPSDYDVRHHFVASGLWDLPIFRTRRDALGNLLGGWQVSGILTTNSGFPWTPVISNCVSTLGPTLCPSRPTGYLGGALTDTSNEAFMRQGGNFPGGGARYFITANPGGRLPPGIGRNSFRGPKYFGIDMSLTKRFGLFGLINEGSFFEVKANFFNIFNMLNLQPFGFDTSSTRVLDPNFGRAERGLAGRVIEIQGRFSF